MIRRRVYLQVLEGDVPEASHRLEREGYALVPGAFDPDEVASLRAAIDEVFETHEPDVRGERIDPAERADFRYEMFNRSAECQAAVGDRRILDVIEPLLGQDCHVIANTAWRNPPRERATQGGGNWHIDAGPHVPRPAGVPWDDRIPYPIFAIGCHLMLADCSLDDGPTAVIPGSHRSGQHPPFDRLADDDLTCDGVGEVRIEAKAGDVVLFASDVWHRRAPTGPGDSGRYFLQIHYGRRDLAPRLHTSAQTSQVSEAAAARATTDRERTVIGLHPPGFYDG